VLTKAFVFVFRQIQTFCRCPAARESYERLWERQWVLKVTLPVASSAPGMHDKPPCATSNAPFDTQ
jgi:hypothetical protein